MKTKEDLLFDVKWPYYAIIVSVFVVWIGAMATYQLLHFDVYFNNQWLFLLPHLVVFLVCTVVIRLLIQPYYYLWAFRKVENARWLQEDMNFPLPFYPKRKWYFGLIPFYGKYEAQIAEIINSLKDNSDLYSIDLSAYEDNEPISTYKIWYYQVLYAAGLLVVVAAAVFIAFWHYQSTFRHTMDISIILALSVFTIDTFRSFKAPKQLVISSEGVKVGTVSYPWSAINNINYYKTDFNNETLQLITMQDEVISIPVENYSIKGTHLHGYALYYQREHLLAKAS